MELTALSADTMDRLRCSSCANYLSYFPVRVCADNSSICGRCPVPEDKQSIENAAFQTISQFMRFPCRYQSHGCDEHKQPKDVPLHEKTCPFRVNTCPLFKTDGCDWSGSRPQLLTHCRDAHQDMYLEGSLNLDLSCSSEKYYLLEHQGLLLIFRQYFDVLGKILNFEMSTTEFETTPKSYSCSLKVQNGQNNLSMDFISTNFDEVAPNQIGLESFTKQAAVQITVGEVIIDPNEYLDVEMLTILKCFVCQNYAVPPIYHCVANSETLCAGCENSHRSSCAPCSQNQASTRNISLDKMANFLNYPCRNAALGCPFVSKPEQTEAHLAACEFAPLQCPVAPFSACTWRGLTADLTRHVLDEHEALPNSARLTQRLGLDEMSCELIKFAGRLFRLTGRRTEEKYFWSVQVVGARDDFKYEIEIVDPARAGRRLLVRQQCGALTEKGGIFEEGAAFCYFFADQIRDFVVEEAVDFKLHIFV